jgi:hypothetical protein
LVSATLGRKKLGSGLDALKYFKAGQMDKLKEYCLEDVRLTRDLYEYGKQHGKLLYYQQRGLQIASFIADFVPIVCTIKAVIEVANYIYQTSQFAQTTLRLRLRR